MNEELRARVADALLDAGAVVLAPDAPVTFKSGIRSPVYVDARRLPFRPEAWATVIDALRRAVELHGIAPDVIAGIESAGIPHSAALGYATRVPSVFVRKRAKAHGTRRLVEGGPVEGRRVLLIEDLVTTGGSSLAGVEALRAAGATVSDLLCIASYDFEEARSAFEAAGVRLHVAAPFPVLLEVAARRGLASAAERATIEAWWRDPRGWEPPSVTDGAGGAGA